MASSKGEPSSALSSAPAAKHSVIVKVGSGFYSNSKWRPDCRLGCPVPHRAARLLLVDADGAPAEAKLTGPQPVAHELCRRMFLLLPPGAAKLSSKTARRTLSFHHRASGRGGERLPVRRGDL